MPCSTLPANQRCGCSSGPAASCRNAAGVRATRDRESRGTMKIRRPQYRTWRK